MRSFDENDVSIPFLLVGIPVIALLVIISSCHSAGMPVSAVRDPSGVNQIELTSGSGLHLAQLIVVFIVARGVGALFQFIRQPRVVGEMVAGILLGPSLFGSIVPHASAFLFSVF